MQLFRQLYTEMEGDVHGGHETAGKVLDIHFSHFTKMATNIRRYKSCNFLSLIQHYQRILTESLIPTFVFTHRFKSVTLYVCQYISIFFSALLFSLLLFDQCFRKALLRFHYLQFIIMMLAIFAKFTRVLTFSYARMSNFKHKSNDHTKITKDIKIAGTDKKKDTKVNDSKQTIQLYKFENKQTIKKGKQQQINWKKYGRQVSDILQSKKQLIDIDLAFLANKISSGELPNNQEITNTLKTHIKSLKQVSFSLLPQLIQLAFSVGLVTPPQIFQQAYLDHFKYTFFSIQENQALAFPTYFLKRVGLQTFLLCADRSIDEGAIALKFFGSILSVNELKKADQLCSARLARINVEQVAKLLSIFRQIRKRGTFVELSEGLILENQAQLTNKAIITAVISFLELGNREAVSKLEITLAERVISEKFAEREVISLLQVMHKYKAGKLAVWQGIETCLTEKHKKIPFEHLFLVMSGLTRNYHINADYLQQLIQGDPSLSYASQLQGKQFVQFYFVLYAHYCLLPLSQQKKIQPVLLSAVKAAKLTSIYMQIQSFFLYLIDSSAQKQKQHLKASYPDDNLLALLSCIRQFENTDIRQQQQYQKDLISRFGLQNWKKYRHVIVAQQFIRYKLVSTLQKNPETSQFRADDL